MAKLPRHVRYPRITEAEVLALADEWFDRHGAYPTAHSGNVGEEAHGTWSALDQCLIQGLRGLPGGTSLSRLIAANREVRRDLRRNKLEAGEILKWADNWFHRTGAWPQLNSGDIPEAPGQTWERISKSLRRGVPGAERGTSLARFLNQQRGVPIHGVRPPLTVPQVLEWIDAHYERTGKWPQKSSGDVFGVPGESWSAIDASLYTGSRGLPKGGSLARGITQYRGVRPRRDLPKLTVLQINAWVLAHYHQYGRLPRVKDGIIPDSGGELWVIIDESFRHGRRGLEKSGYTTLKEFLKSRFPRPEFGQYAYLRPVFTIRQILTWADEFHKRTGAWPNLNSGEIPGSNGDKWRDVGRALYRRLRGISTATSLDELLFKHRNVTPRLRGDMSVEEILSWADAYHKQTGKWPTRNTKDPVPGAPHENWATISQCLREGIRGLPKELSLSELLWKHRGKRSRHHTTELTLPQIEKWVRSYYEEHGHWPSHYYGGVVKGVPDENWRGIIDDFKHGRRGLAATGYTSLREFTDSLTKPGMRISGRHKAKKVVRIPGTVPIPPTITDD